MLRIVFIMLLGVAVGRLLRGRNLKWLPAATTLLVWSLLFLLGYEVGGDPRVIGSLATLGIEALTLSLAGILGSAALAWLLWRMATKRGEERP